ncbi:MAG: HAMP domain-containing sensor histidine kinase [Tissierellia bacterium]|nr:HAMP domain-containing sensor histidine kinase [Tissierellia bacterium]
MKRSIKRRMSLYYSILLVVTVTLLDLMIVLGFRQYAYDDLRANLQNSVRYSVSSLERYYPDKDIQEMIAGDARLVWNLSESQIQVINTKGELIYDSIGAVNDPVGNYTDVQNALMGEPGSRVGKVDYSSEWMMSVSEPIAGPDGGVMGVMRWTSSLSNVHALMARLTRYLALFTLLIVGVGIFMSRVISKSLVRPIQELQSTALALAGGQYKKRIHLNTGDELSALGETMNTLADEIIRKDQIKNDFISSISHELRTPLTSIKGWAVILKETDDDQKEIIDEGLDIIESEADRLSKMVEELLDFSRFISGRITLHREELDIGELFRDISVQMGPRARNEGIELKTEFTPGDQLILGDEDRLRQLFINLVDNALKFTPQGGWVLLETKVNGEYFEAYVSDNGVGMDPDEVKRVKEKFYKGTHSNSHSGLGLSIADEIARLHKGAVDIVSEKGVGTTIRVRLPREGGENE